MLERVNGTGREAIACRNGHGPANGSPNGHGNGTTNGSGTSSPAVSLAQLIRDAEALHATLAEAKAQSTRLMAGLRSQLEKTRLVSEAMRSLRQIGLAEVAD